MTAPSAITAPEFAALMAKLDPFEPHPRLAVGVSGGADSLALALLAAEWAFARHGTVIALTVDHRLRPDSAVEAEQVAAWMAARGIAHAVLVRDGPRPGADLQAAARRARYHLLEQHCAKAGILHLLLAHHREDQAETLLLRLGRGSGLEGLTAMAPGRPTHWGRILRPLLEIPRARLAATLTARAQPWINDPSNADPAYARARMRALAPTLAAEGLSAARLAETAARLGQARAALDEAATAATLRLVTPHPAGFVRLDRAGFSRLPPEIAHRLLVRLLAAIGGEPLPPRRERLDRLNRVIAAGDGSAHTLAGCRVVADGAEWVICREPGRAAPPVVLAAEGPTRWDRRVIAHPIGGPVRSGLRLGGLGPAPGARLGEVARRLGIPSCARPTIPALLDDRGVFAVPHLGYNRDGSDGMRVEIEITPARALTGHEGYLVACGSRPISRAMSSAPESAGFPRPRHAKPGRTQP